MSACDAPRRPYSRPPRTRTPARAMPRRPTRRSELRACTSAVNVLELAAVIPMPPTIRFELLLRHERILVVERRRERLLDRPGADPPHQVELGARLVVRTRATRAAEWLLTHDGARRLVVHIEVAGGVAQGHHRFAHRAAVVREHGARERVRRRGVNDLQRVFPFVVVVHVRRDDRTEDLLAEEAVAGILSLNQRRLDEVAVLSFRRSSSNDLGILLRVAEIVADLAERLLVDDGAHEVAEIAHVADADLFDHRNGAIAHFVPQ